MVWSEYLYSEEKTQHNHVMKKKNEELETR